jgi:class 3 adenylate cyclase/tetratricopeptide (TPR) repeat protein
MVETAPEELAACERCGAALPPDALFCPKCGTPVRTPAGEERRVVTVVFADVAGSTELAGRLDPERFREVMAAFYRDASSEVASLRGRVEKFIGDAVMAVFGLLQVHEDDALRAVRAGLAIRDRAAALGDELGLASPLVVRVGISTGAVATGSGPADQFLVSGAPVNLAARLQQAAEPGEVLVGDATWQLTRDAVGFGPPRSVEARGFGGDVPAWPVTSLSVKSVRRTIPLVGREHELALLSDVLRRARNGRRPHLVTVLGEAGIGKTRLVDEFLVGVPEGTVVLSGRVGRFEEDPTFAPVADMIRRWLGLEPDAPQEHVRERLEEAVTGCCEPSEADQAVARLGLALGLAEPTSDGHRFRAAEVRAGLVTLLHGLALTGPVVVVFDDLQLARPTLLEVVEEIARTARRMPLVLVCLAREDLLEHRPGWGSGVSDAVTLRLDPLPPREATALARAAGEGLDEEAAQRIAAHAGGNPFFIVESTGMLLSEHLHSDVDAPHSHVLPPTVQAVVASRIDHLPDEARDLFRKASVFPASTFDLAELELIADPDEETLRVLEDQELLVRDPADPDAWRVRHELLREVAYESLAKRDRLRLHLQVSDGLAERDGAHRHPRGVAYHLEQAARAALDLDPGDRRLAARAMDALAHAGDLARRRIESRAAVDLYERALSLAGPAEGWGILEAGILSGLGEARYWLGEYEAATEALSRALELGEREARVRTHASRFLADIALNVHADPDGADKLFDQALSAARELGDPWALARTLLMAGWVPYWRNDMAGARALFEEALSVATSGTRDLWAESRALTSLVSVTSAAGDEQDCVALGERALAVARESGDPFSVAVAQGYLGDSFRRMWRLPEAVAHLDDAVRTFRDLGARWELASALSDRGQARRLAGDLGEAEADLREAVRMCRELGERNLIGWTFPRLIRVLVSRGDVDGAREAIRDLPPDLLGNTSLEPSLQGVEALMALAEGDVDRARELSLALLEARRATGLRNDMAAETWWVGRVFGPEAVGGEDVLEDARRTLEKAHWIQMLEEPELFPGIAPAS